MSATALPGQAAENPPEEKMDKSLQKENKRLRGDIKQMEMKIKAMQVELTKSFQMKDRLEGLCRELQKQNKYIKAESSSKIQEANARGKELASEVQNNMGFMKSINENLAAISSESLTVKRENEELAKKIAILKGHYEEREQILQAALKDTNESLQKAKLELGETNLKSAEEKEKLIGEMQKLADALLQSREQIKDAKQTEITLRGMIQSYEDKFNGLQKALKDTNGSYEEFRSEMNNVTSRTKILEKETVKWQERWEESNSSLNKMRTNYVKVKEDLQKSQDSLDKMKSLCRRLHNENRDLQAELPGMKGSGSGSGGGDSGDSSSSTTTNPSNLSDAAEETLQAIKVEFANANANTISNETAESTKNKNQDAPATPTAAAVKVQDSPAGAEVIKIPVTEQEPKPCEQKPANPISPPEATPTPSSTVVETGTKTKVASETAAPTEPPKSPEKSPQSTDSNGNTTETEVLAPVGSGSKSPPLNESSSDAAAKSDGEGSKGKKNKRKKGKK